MWTIPVELTPGPGQSLLSVTVRVAGEPGPLVKAFSFGKLSEEQLRERNRGVMRDADGNWIKVSN